MQMHHGLRLAADELAVVTLVGAGGKTSALFRLADEAVASGRRVVTTTTTRLFASQAEQAPGRLVVDPDGNGSIDWDALEAELGASWALPARHLADRPQMRGAAADSCRRAGGAGA